MKDFATLLIALDRLRRRIEAVNEHLGRALAWLTLAMVLIQFTVVLLRYVFSIGFIPLQESVWYLHGVIFMLGAGYTLRHDGHVRVDIFYREAAPKVKAIINLLGVTLFLLPVCVLIWWLSWSYVTNSWLIFEGSAEVSGLPFIFLLKTVILVFVVVLVLQGVALLLRACLALADYPLSDA